MQLSSISLAITRFTGGLSYNPSSLFAAGEQGVWYDPSDYTTMFQDSAGTTPVTAVEQPVGKILDKSGRGNHATQAISFNRPILSARYNLLTKTEQFDDAYWTVTAGSIVPNATTDPLGGNTADKLQVNTTNAAHGVGKVNVTFTPIGTSVTVSCHVKKAELSWCIVGDGQQLGVYFDLANGVFGTIASGWTNPQAVSLGNGWYRISATVTSILSSGFAVYAANANNGITFAGANNTDGIYIWGASLIPVEQSALPYQRVNTATDYNTTGFNFYLKANGTNSAMSTGNIDFASTPYMTVWTGVQKLNDTTAGCLYELSADWNTNAGTFNSFNLTSGFNAASRGTAAVSGSSQISSISALIRTTSVLTATHDIAGSLTTLQKNNDAAVNATGSKGSGNFGLYPLYLFARAGTTFPLNINFYGLIVRGAQSTAAQITNTKTWINGKTGAY